MQDLISVIVPVYNMEKYLDRCMKSVLEQTYRNLEIILVDDGSTDASPQMCDEYAMKDNRVKVVHKQNGGLSDARNAGLTIATGTYIGYVDSDDWIESDMYECMYSACVENQAEVAVCRYASVYPDRTVKAGTGNIYVFNKEELVDKYISDDDEIIIYNSVWSKLFHRSIVEGELFPVGHNSEDIMYTTRSFCKAARGVYIDRCLYHYVQDREGSIMNTNRTERMFRDEIPFWRAHIKCIREMMSSHLGDKAAYWFYRRMLAYYLDLVRCADTKAAARQLADMIRSEKQEVKRVYRQLAITGGDKVRMQIFMMRPGIYYWVNRIYGFLRTGTV
ncbi:MAG: glycosyltransferase [Lachnospiraceae bacterium]|nr:glycosyltransferase [Lachnospiraceae bacterium]